MVDIAFIDANVGWLAETKRVWRDGRTRFDHSLLLLTEDSGKTWDPRLETDSEIKHIDFVSQAIGWVSTEDTLLATVDGGLTWKTLEADGVLPGGRIDFIDDLRGWVDGEEPGTLVATADGGRTWEITARPCAEGGGAFSFIDQNQGWLLCGGQRGAGSQAKSLLTTEDGGRNWTLLAQSYPWPRITTPTPVGGLGAVSIHGYVEDLTFLDSTNGYMSLARVPALGLTDDGGRSWSFVSADCELPCFVEGVARIQFITPLEGFWVNWVWNAVLLGTNDGGETSTTLYPTPSVSP